MQERDARTVWPIGSKARAPEAEYHAQWKAFALRHHLALCLLSGFIPWAVALFEWSRHWGHEPVLCLVLIFLWLGLALAAVWWAGEFRCPRCRRRYAALGHRRGGTNVTRGIFDKVCANCKLRKFERGG